MAQFKKNLKNFCGPASYSFSLLYVHAHWFKQLLRFSKITAELIKKETGPQNAVKRNRGSWALEITGFWLCVTEHKNTPPSLLLDDMLAYLSSLMI